MHASFVAKGSVWSPRVTFALLLGFTMVWLSGCASGPKFVAAPPPPKDKALVYIYRQGGFRPGAAGSHHVFINRKRVTILRHGGYFPCLVDPGQITMGLDLRATPLLVLQGLIDNETDSAKFVADAGKTYYVKFLLGGWSTGARLESVDAAVGAKEIQDCSLLEPAKP